MQFCLCQRMHQTALFPRLTGVWRRHITQVSSPCTASKACGTSA